MTTATVSDLLVKLLFGEATLVMKGPLKHAWFDNSDGKYYWQSLTPHGLLTTPVKESFIKARMDVYRTSVSRSMSVQTQRMLNGAMDLDVWQTRMAKEIKDAYIINLQIGRGGKAVTTFADYGRVGGHLKFEYGKLDNFAREIELGLLSDAQIEARIQMYTRGAQVAYWDGLNAAKKEAGYDEEHRVTNPAEHCDDCLGFEAEGWMPIGHFPEPGMGSQCMHNCQCDKVFRKSIEAQEAAAAFPGRNEHSVSGDISDVARAGNSKMKQMLRQGDDVTDMERRKEAKDRIARVLSERTEFSYDEVNDFIKQWAYTSNDNDMRSLHIQKMASELFANDMSAWQMERYTSKLERRNWFISRGSNMPSATSTLFEDALGNYVGPQAYGSVDNATKELLQAMYDYTQNELSRANISKIKLYRGVDITDDAAKAYWHAHQDEIIDNAGNVLESWSTDLTEARTFGQYVMEAEVPASRVVGTARTGFGCLNEMELVVTGNVPGDSIFATFWN